MFRLDGYVSWFRSIRLSYCCSNGHDTWFWFHNTDRGIGISDYFSSVPCDQCYQYTKVPESVLFQIKLFLGI